MARRDSTFGDEEVLSPEEIDISEDEHVANLGEGRYVVGSDGPPDEEKVDEVRAALTGDATATRDTTTQQPDPQPADPDPAPAETHAPDAGAQQSRATPQQEHGQRQTQPREEPELTGADVKQWITEELERSESRYAYRIAAKTGDSVSHQQLASDDIGMAFDALLMWYAQQVGHGTAVEDALGILLAESNIRVKYPTARLVAYLEDHDLGPDDSISDLINAVQDDDGLVFPLRRRNQS